MLSLLASTGKTIHWKELDDCATGNARDSASVWWRNNDVCIFAQREKSCNFEKPKVRQSQEIYAECLCVQHLILGQLLFELHNYWFLTCSNSELLETLPFGKSGPGCDQQIRIKSRKLALWDFWNEGAMQSVLFEVCGSFSNNRSKYYFRCQWNV